MKKLIILLTIIISLSSCNQNNTVFASTHNAHKYFSSLPKESKININGHGSGYSIGNGYIEKDYQISIKGNETTRNKLLRTYKDYIEKEIKKSGAKIHGRGVSGKVSGFDFNYKTSSMTGIIKVNSVLTSNENIELDIFIYEHP